MMVTFDKYVGYGKKDLSEAMAWFMLAEGSMSTTNGNWSFTFDELHDLFGVDLENDPEMVQMILDALEKVDAANGILYNNETWVIDSRFDLNFALAFCPAVEDECQKEWDEV